jgi:membrane associated rhomboid family serine protease
MANFYRKKRSFFDRIGLNNFFIFANIAVFLIVYPLISFVGEKVIKYVALNPEFFANGFFWTLLTSMFMHANFTHLFVNMVSMFFIGNFVEKLIGKKRYLWFYLTAGFAGGLIFVFFAYFGQYIPGGEKIFGGVDSFAVGASGALFGLGGLLAILIPRLKVLVFFIIPMPMWLAMVVLMFGLWGISIAAGLPIGNTAHFGGLLVGVAYGVYLRSKYSHKVKMLNRILT